MTSDSWRCKLLKVRVGSSCAVFYSERAHNCVAFCSERAHKCVALCSERAHSYVEVCSELKLAQGASSDRRLNHVNLGPLRFLLAYYSAVVSSIVPNIGQVIIHHGRPLLIWQIRFLEAISDRARGRLANDFVARVACGALIGLLSK